MKSRYLLSPEAAEDLASIWQYIHTQSSLEMYGVLPHMFRGFGDGRKWSGLQKRPS